MELRYKIYPLGDTAACIDLGNVIDEAINKKIIAIRTWLLSNSFDGLKDIIVAYSSVTLYYDPLIIRKRNHLQSTVFKFVSERLETAFHESALGDEANSRLVRIPVCYENEFAIDIDFISAQKNIGREEIIRLHTEKIYNVYMIGFLPGFSYLGKIDEKIAIARKPKPVPVVAGSVGIAGMQTGIYPLSSPGGWQIIGKTPLKMFDANASEPIMMSAGDQVQFYEISREEFDSYSITNRGKIED